MPARSRSGYVRPPDNVCMAPSSAAEQDSPGRHAKQH